MAVITQGEARWEHEFTDEDRNNFICPVIPERVREVVTDVFAIINRPEDEEERDAMMEAMARLSEACSERTNKLLGLPNTMELQILIERIMRYNPSWCKNWCTSRYDSTKDAFIYRVLMDEGDDLAPEDTYKLEVKENNIVWTGHIGDGEVILIDFTKAWYIW